MASNIGASQTPKDTGKRKRKSTLMGEGKRLPPGQYLDIDDVYGQSIDGEERRERSGRRSQK